MKRILIPIAVVLAMVSCTKDEQQTATSSDRESVLALAEDFVFEGEQTKTVISQNGKCAPTFAWKAGDVIGVIPMNNETVQSNYRISTIGTDPRTATFDGGVWALKAGKGYAAYYPYQKEAVLSGESLEFSFQGQTQSANNSLAHIGDYDYMYAPAVVASPCATSFSFKHLVSLVRFQITVPKTGRYTDLTLESTSDWFAGKAALSLKDGTMSPTQSLKICSVALNNIAVSSGEVLTVWLSMLPTTALDGGSLTVKLTGEGSCGTATISNVKTFEAGKAYSFSCTAGSGEDTGYVDLGLSVKWATCNLGASSPEGYGDYYAWGETEMKSDYSKENYKYYKSETVGESEVNGYTKYVTKSKAGKYGFKGFYDDKTVLEPGDDVAHVLLGGKWRLPTDSEFTELRKNCTWKHVTYKGVNGCMVTSKKEGYTDRWIFLPAAGFRYDTGLGYVESDGYYWSSSLDKDFSDFAWYVDFYSGSVNRGSGSRHIGQSVRPVSDTD